MANLIGPEPKPVQEPKFVAPFRADGRNVIDKNRRVVFRINFGDYMISSFRTELPASTAFELARVVADALTEKYAEKTEDSPSPF